MIFRKSFIHLLVFLILFVSCKKQLKENSFKDTEYAITKKKFQHSESEENLILIEKSYFNKHNQPIQISSFLKGYQFKLSMKKIFYYNSHLQPVKFEAYSYFQTGGLKKIYDTIYMYDKTLVKTKKIHDATDKILRTIEFFYKNDSLIKEHVDIPSYSPYWYEYEYNGSGLLSTKKMYNDLGLRGTYHYTYDLNKLVLETFEYGNGKDIFEFIYDNNFLVAINKYEQLGTGQPVLFARDQFFYDQHGRLKKEINSNSRVAFDPPVFTYISIYEY